MKHTEKSLILKEFRTIPGVGKSIAADFWNIGLRSLGGLKDANSPLLFLAMIESTIALEKERHIN